MWYCSLSRTPGVPIERDDTIESHHPDPALAIALGVLAEREDRQSAASPGREQVSSGSIAVPCCENFS
jgi:hypothetical protein